MAQVVVVTGASRGIGAATAVWLSTFGASVVMVGRDEDVLAGVAERVKLGGSAVLPIAGDLTHDGIAEQIASAALARFGRIDAVINNAGVAGDVVHMSDASLDMWRQVYEVNVFAVLSCIKATLPALRDVRGRLVNVSSMVAGGPAESLGAYASSKASVSSLTKTLAIEEPGITALAYQPGPTRTDLMEVILGSAPLTMSAATADSYRRMELTGFVDLSATTRKLALLATRVPHSWTGNVVDYTDRSIDDLDK
ncbi:MAG TPA: SDR family oxidoreductase [Streptosporangiaceae bacterium]|nr:SDR family oxidoreductase [Streptosporangiaceae bacterium]